MNELDRHIRRAADDAARHAGQRTKIVVPPAPAEPDPESARGQVEAGHYRNVKVMPAEGELRERFEGDAALALIAKRALVGVSKLREMRGLSITDRKPLPEGEYALTPISLLRNGDGTANLLVNDLCSEVLYQATIQITNGAGGTTVPVVPKLSVRNPARKLIIHNLTANSMFCTFDGVYDEGTDTTARATTPALNTGRVVLANSVVEIPFRCQANPRVIAPSGAGNANIIVMR